MFRVFFAEVYFANANCEVTHVFKTHSRDVLHTQLLLSVVIVLFLLSLLTWAVKLDAARGGSFLTLPATFPRRISMTDTFLTLKPTLSPGRASDSDSWCISTDLTSVVTLLGAKVTTVPGFRMPVSTRPTGTVPMPESEQKAAYV